MADEAAATPHPSRAHFRPYRRRLVRLVEGQHRISTNRLADNVEDQALLEALVEEAKPTLPPAARGLHYLLATPFRYGHARPSRFRRAGERPGVFYASEKQATAVAETAYWRLLFFSRSPGMRLPSAGTEYTAFSVRVAAGRSLDLAAPPLDRGRAAWTDTAEYSACQVFAAEARAIDTQGLRYPSARDPAGGANYALFDPAAFADRRPKHEQTWQLRFEGARLTAFGAFPAAARHDFTFDQFGLAAP